MDLHLFKQGVEPKWEDPKCEAGGKWTALVPKMQGKALVDVYWLHAVSAAGKLGCGQEQALAVE